MNIFYDFIAKSPLGPIIGLEPIAVEPPKPPERCCVCHKTLTKIFQEDGIYCRECSTLLTIYFARPTVSPSITKRLQNVPLEYIFRCPRCIEHIVTASSPSTINEFKTENLKSCMCGALLHPPTGFCVFCWKKLTSNNICINHVCQNYQKPQKTRFTHIG